VVKRSDRGTLGGADACDERKTLVRTSSRGLMRIVVAIDCSILAVGIADIRAMKKPG
jgi:hypothetical protein